MLASVECPGREDDVFVCVRERGEGEGGGGDLAKTSNATPQYCCPTTALPSGDGRVFPAPADAFEKACSARREVRNVGARPDAWGLGFRVQVGGFRDWGLGFRGWGLVVGV